MIQNNIEESMVFILEKKSMNILCQVGYFIFLKFKQFQMVLKNYYLHLMFHSKKSFSYQNEIKNFSLKLIERIFLIN